MFEKIIRLNTIDDIKKFVKIASSKEFEITLQSGKEKANAKDINQIFKLDLTKPLSLKADCKNQGEFSRQLTEFYRYTFKK